MRRLPLPGRFRRATATTVALACLASASPAAAAVVPTLTRVTQEGGIAADCTAPLPAGAGAASATYSHSAGIGTIRTDWNIPDRITPGSQVTLGLQISATQGFAGLILLNAPSDFGGSPAPFEVAGSVGPAGGAFSGATTITFTPTRAFTPGETHVLRLGNGCNAFLYEYVATGTPDGAPATPGISPRTTRPVPGVLTSYAAPRPGRVAVLPVPANGCAAPATASQVPAQPAAGGGVCEVDIFLRRNGGGRIDDPEAVFAIDGRFQYDFGSTPEARRRAQAVCAYFALDAISTAAGGDVDDAAFRRCVTAVSRILKRAEDLRRRREGGPIGSTSHGARRCAGASVRLRGQAARRPPVSFTCRRTATSSRITLRSTLPGAAVGALVSPSSTLLVGRGDAVPFRPGDRIDVLWRITPSAGTTTIRTPAPPAVTRAACAVV